jgi:hypothetical protein
MRLGMKKSIEVEDIQGEDKSIGAGHKSIGAEDIIGLKIRA